MHCHRNPRILKRFLDFAMNGRLDDSTPTGEDADSAFEEDVANVVRSFGFLADNQVGSAGFRIDLGIRHPDKPGTYILAVECDGATYHSALWARERDRLRQDVLEHLGWHFHRIWSTDWFGACGPCKPRPSADRGAPGSRAADASIQTGDLPRKQLLRTA